MPAGIVEESLMIRGASPALSGVLAYPEVRAPEYAVLLCAPHPNFAGNMDNNVIEALSAALAEEAVVLRFDYRGVGQSEIHLPSGDSVFDYWAGIEEQGDFRDPLEDVGLAAMFLKASSGSLPLVVCGYSFGALMATRYGLADPAVLAMAGIAPPYIRCPFEFLAGCTKPCLLLSGELDFVYSHESAQALRQSGGERLHTILLIEEDHFFRGHEESVSQKVREFFRSFVQR